MGDLPGASWLCPTYARFPDYGFLLEERAESFSRQDYQGPKELVILNDCREQTLVCDAPGVRVVNLPYRLPSLGDKMNLLVELAKYDLLMIAEDDDLHLAHATTQAVKMIGTDDVWLPPQVIYLPKGSPPIFHHSVGVRLHASIFTREAWQKVGGFPRMSGAQDRAMKERLVTLRHHIEDYPRGIPPKEFAYVYRWGVSPNHLSGNTDHEAAWKAEGEKAHTPGRFVIRPHWRVDYAELCRQALPA
jgi:hypothetical protein